MRRRNTAIIFILFSRELLNNGKGYRETDGETEEVTGPPYARSLILKGYGASEISV